MLPVGHDQGIRHVPWLTLTIIVALFVLDFVRVARSPSSLEWDAALVSRARAEIEVLRVEGRRPPAPNEDALTRHALAVLESGHPIGHQEFLDAVRAGKAGDPIHVEIRQLRECDQAIDTLERRDMAVQLAYRPADGPGPRLLLYALVHGSFLSLFGNLLLLWLCGCNLEDRWGRLVFGGLLLGGVLAGSLGYTAWHWHSHVGLVGFSGAVAAAMGAFTVSFHRARIRFAYLRLANFAAWLSASNRLGAATPDLPLVGYFRVHAWAALPLWFVDQLLRSVGESVGNTAVAYSAHVSGFAFGALVALVLRASGIERRRLLPASLRGAEWKESPELIAAFDLLRDDRKDDALKVLSAFVERQPHHHAARERLAVVALERGRADLVAAHISEALLNLAEHADPDEVLHLYRQLNDRMPAVVPGERALFEVVRAAVARNEAVIAGAAARRLVEAHPQSTLGPGGLHTAAGAFRAAGAREKADALLALLRERYPEDPLALATTGSPGGG